MKKKILSASVIASSYYQHEQWFELCDLINGDKQGKKIINSYGRVREIWEDGTYRDIYNGKEVVQEKVK